MPVVDDIARQSGVGPVDVDLVRALEVNALAPSGRNAVKHGTRLLELALITSYLRTTAADVLVLRADDYGSGSRRIKSFVSEAVGLGMLTELVRHLEGGSEVGPLYDFDALPAALTGRFRRRGVRPDLLFALDRRRLAGESRGRTERRPVRVTKQPRDRLNELLPWAEAHGGHPLVMTWCYLSGTGITVDVYREADPGARLALDLTGRPGGSRGTRDEWPRDRGPDDVGTEYLFDHVLATRARVEAQLYRSAPRTDLRVAGRSLRGGWAPADLIADERGVLFLGVLDRAVDPDAGARIAAGLADRGTDDEVRLSVLVRERLVLALASGRTGQPWDLLDDQASS
ncbi:hypothetical protein FHX81_6415 [Saccharothrix saharensis]|uniref:Uncharacterized protein n=1 Tax=Saccharothrix saharensis TaxID=571190 RepID=A0A543JMB5_9PSEU|nr:hypothetical protein FHX81_6415 [Saccharothrix saharensis]